MAALPHQFANIAGPSPAATGHVEAAGKSAKAPRIQPSTGREANTARRNFSPIYGDLAFVSSGTFRAVRCSSQRQHFSRVQHSRSGAGRLNLYRGPSALKTACLMKVYAALHKNPVCRAAWEGSAAEEFRN